MSNSIKVWWRIFLVLGLLALGAPTILAQEPPSDQPPANVAGNWTFYTKGEDGRTDTKHVELKQDGGKLSGHFKGPNQSGGIEGTVEGRHIVFKTKTRNVFTFRGQADGDSMHGTFGIFLPRRGLMHGEWEARRSQ
jgi:hypothetical protein